MRTTGENRNPQLKAMPRSASASDLLSPTRQGNRHDANAHQRERAGLGHGSRQLPERVVIEAPVQWRGSRALAVLLESYAETSERKARGLLRGI